MSNKKRTRSSRKRRSRPAALTRATLPDQELQLGSYAHRYRLGWPALCAVGLVLMVLASYLPAMLWGGFVWDDVDHFLAELGEQGEPALRDLAGLKRIWFSPAEVQEPHYRPLTYTTFWLEHKLWGFAPNGYHVVNVLLHAANVLLLWRILAALAVPGAWVVAAAFAVHPVHVESVAWAIERKDVLSGLFYLGCVSVWLPFIKGPKTGEATAAAATNPWRYGFALALLAAGMLAQNIVVTLPAALLVLRWWQCGRVTLPDVARLIPFFGVALAVVVLDQWLVSTATPASFDYSVVERLLIAARALWFYVGKLAWPADLAVVYPHWDVGVGTVPGWIALGAAVALVAALWHFRTRIGRGPLAGVVFFAVTLSPTLGFVDHTYLQFSFVADRFQYVAGIGVLAVLIGGAAVGANRLPATPRKAVAASSAAVLALLGTLTWQQAGIYRDDVTFFEHVIAHNPNAARAHLNLADALMQDDRMEEAAAAARIAVAQRPDSHDAHINLAVALVHLERPDEAERHLRRAAQLAPAESTVLENLAVLLTLRNQLGEAEALLRRAVDLAPRNLSATRNLAKLLDVRQQPERALALYDRVVELGADDAAVHAARGSLLFRLERRDEALAAYRKALALDPTHEAARRHIALAGQARQEAAGGARQAAEAGK